jgi:hypothetical protein
MNQQNANQPPDMRNDPSDPFGRKGLQVAVARSDTPGALAKLPQLQGYDFSTLNSTTSSSSSNSNSSAGSIQRKYDLAVQRHQQLPFSGEDDPEPSPTGASMRNSDMPDFSIEMQQDDITDLSTAPSAKLDDIRQQHLATMNDEQSTRPESTATINTYHP